MIETNNKIARAEKTLDTIGEWIRATDQKAGILLALQSIMLTLLIPNYLKTITERFQTHAITLLNEILIILAVICLGWSILEALLVVLPRIANKATSHLYFGSIKKMTLSEYTREMKHMTKNKYFEEVCEQIHTNSIITITKYQKSQGAIFGFLVGIGLFIASYISLKFF